MKITAVHVEIECMVCHGVGLVRNNEYDPRDMIQENRQEYEPCWYCGGRKTQTVQAPIEELRNCLRGG